jgi:hypothetical protein
VVRCCPAKCYHVFTRSGGQKGQCENGEIHCIRELTNNALWSRETKTSVDARGSLESREGKIFRCERCSVEPSKTSVDARGSLEPGKQTSVDARVPCRAKNICRCEITETRATRLDPLFSQPSASRNG